MHDLVYRVSGSQLVSGLEWSLGGGTRLLARGYFCCTGIRYASRGKTRGSDRVYQAGKARLAVSVVPSQIWQQVGWGPGIRSNAADVSSLAGEAKSISLYGGIGKCDDD